MVSTTDPRAPVFRNGSVVRYGHGQAKTSGSLEERLLDMVFRGGATLEAL